MFVILKKVVELEMISGMGGITNYHPTSATSYTPPQQQVSTAAQQFAASVYGQKEVDKKKKLVESRKKPKNAKAGELINGMLARETSKKAKKQLDEELRQLGDEFLGKCYEDGTVIMLVSEQERDRNIKLQLGEESVPIGSLLKRGYAGVFDPNYGLVVISDGALGQRYSMTSVHEMAHAYDHALSHKSKSLSLSKRLWRGFRGNFITRYSAKKPEEYFAESVEGYFVPHLRKRLEENDPQMYRYLRELFTGVKGLTNEELKQRVELGKSYYLNYIAQESKIKI